MSGGERISEYGVVERAFSLARSGRFSSRSQIQKALRQEGYIRVGSYLDGKGISRELANACKLAKSQFAGASPPMPGTPL